MKNTKKDNSNFKNAKKTNKEVIRNIPSLKYTSYTEYRLVSTNITTSVFSSSFLTSMQTILQNFPAHATPIYQNGNLKLRQRVFVHHIELRLLFVGAQSNALASADLFNSIRLAVYRVGPSYQESSTSYLTNVVSAGVLDDVEEIYYDKITPLPSQAFDSNINYNVPQVRTSFHQIPINRRLNWFSLTSTGTATWDTETNDYMIDVVSDSAIAPHPTMEWSARIFFSYR